jgi:glycosyltransferase involved in cell wall biosynthesis
MKFSVIICTRNRGPLIEQTIHSILAGARLPDELLVIDQSDDDATGEVVRRIAESEPRLRYLPTLTRGLSRARNVGIREACGDVLVFTDDDVIVLSDWLARIIEEYQNCPNLGIVFGTVIPPENYDWQNEHIPYIILTTMRPVTRSYFQVSGMGANMCVSRATVQAIGDFEEQLGAGTPLIGFEDFEYAFRALYANPMVRIHHVDDIRVVHHAGARKGADKKRFTSNMSGKGRGLFWAFLLKNRFRPAYLYRFIWFNARVIRGFIASAIRFKKPSGVKVYGLTLFYCLKGLFTIPRG